MTLDRRTFLTRAAALGLGAVLGGCRGPAQRRRASSPATGQPAGPARPPGPPGHAPARVAPLFSIAVSEWALRNLLFSGQLDPLDFTRVVRQELEIDTIEYMNPFFLLRAKDDHYLDEMRRRADEQGVRAFALRIRVAGSLGHPDRTESRAAVERHRPWLNAATRLGCRAVSVIVESAGTRAEQIERAVAGLTGLAEFTARRGLDLLVEGSEGMCVDPGLLLAVVRGVDRSTCRAFPDLGVLTGLAGDVIGMEDRLVDLVPYTGALRYAARKSHEANEPAGSGVEPMLRILVGAGYRGPVVISDTGGKRDEKEGVRAARRLLASVRERVALEEIDSGARGSGDGSGDRSQGRESGH